MSRVQLTELIAFSAVAEHRNFTKAAAQVGIALPTMSQTIRALEERLGVLLFNRTTRSVALTEAGERLLAEVQPVLEGIDRAVDSVNAFRDKPAGALRLAVARPFATLLLAPIIQPFLAEYPAIRLEIAVDDTNSDIVSGRFDAGIRIGQRIERDMTVLRIADEFKMLAVAAPAYLERHPRPRCPQDLSGHDCIRFRMNWDGGLVPWEFTKGDERVEIAVDGSLIANDVDLVLSSALAGVGVAYLPETMIEAHVRQGQLVNLIDDWCGGRYVAFLYHPSRRRPPMPLQMFLKFVENWRKRPPERQ